MSTSYNNVRDGGVYFDCDETMLNNEEDGGIYFDPTDQEVIKEHLIPKLQTYQSKDKDCEEDFIVMKNVYDKEPWLLDHTNNPLFKKNEWFYFVTRTQVSVKKIGRGTNSKRKIAGDNKGSWKINATKEIRDEVTKEVIGKRQALKFNTSDDNNNKKKQKIGEGSSSVVPGSNSTNWLMYEYSLPGEVMFQELVVCKIYKGKNSKDDSESTQASSSTNIDHKNVLAPSSLEQQQPLVCYRGEGSMVHQIDTFSSMMETVPERSSQEVTHNVEDEDWIGDLFDKFESTGLDDIIQQQAPINTISQTSAPPARLGDRSLPIEVGDDDEDEDEVLNQELDKFLF